MKQNSIVNKNWRKRNPDKVNAHSKVNYALRKGLLNKLPCEICGEKQVHAHHEDYSKPLEVVWLCKSCHKSLHITKSGETPRLPEYYLNKQPRKLHHKKFQPAPLENKLNEILSLKEQGLSYRKIAKLLDISVTSVYRYANDTKY